MFLRNVAVLGVGSVRPPECLTSADLEARLSSVWRRLHLQNGLLEALTGINSRGMWPKRTNTVDVGARAVARALEAANIPRDQVGCLINAAVSKACIEPSTASTIHGLLALPDTCRNFDVSDACLGFLTALEQAGMGLDAGVFEYAVVVAAESNREVLEATVERLAASTCNHAEFFSEFATLTLGSGAAAMVVGRADRYPEAPRLTGAVRLAATAQNHLCRGTAVEMHTDAGGLLEAGVDLAKRVFGTAADTFGWHEHRPDLLLLHQVGAKHTQKLRAALGLEGIPAPEIFPTWGNVGAASIPIAWEEASRQGLLNREQSIALMGIGSGLNCTMMEVRT